MSVEEIKALLPRYADVWNTKDLSIVDEIIAPDCPHHMNGPINFSGPEGFKISLNNWFKGFPNITATIHDIVAEGDKGVVRATLKGTHQGDLQFLGMPKAIAPTGTEVEFEGTTTCRVANGKIVEVWSIANMAWLQNLARA